MSSHQEPYPDSDQSQRYYADGTSPSAPRPSSWPVHWPQSRQSWPSVQMTNDQTQPSQFIDPVGSLLQVHDAEDIPSRYTLSYNDYPAHIASSHALPLDVGRDFTHIDDDALSNPYVNLPFHYYPDPDYGHQTVNNFYETTYANPQQTSTSQLGSGTQDPFFRPPVQDIHTFQGTSAPADPYSLPSTQLSPVHGGSVFGADISTARSSPGGASLLSVGTVTTPVFTAEAGPRSHPSPVTINPVQGTSRPLPGSPERKRLLRDDSDFSVGRRVLARHDQTSSVHSAASDLHRRGRSGSNTGIHGRGPRIPQERYMVGGTQSFNASEGKQNPITFNLENTSESGIPIVDIINGTDNFRCLQERTQAFGDMGKKTFTLRVLWPGYKPLNKTVATKDWTKERSPVTRGKLAEVVATTVRDLIERYRNEAYDPDYAAWNVGPNGIQLQDIVLVALHHVSKAHFPSPPAL
ncbi:hypothetical protein BS17DRAFT_815155 [Gyrodon lividus]|nr:hypothetical protein BS17DRAFT_815155 [Gyrodon lividus]